MPIKAITKGNINNMSDFCNKYLTSHRFIRHYGRYGSKQRAKILYDKFGDDYDYSFLEWWYDLDNRDKEIIVRMINDFIMGDIEPQWTKKEYRESMRE